MSDSSIIHRGRPRKAIRMPVVPAKAHLRASRILENLTIQLKDMDKTVKYEVEHKVVAKDAEDPHESYLSSEEDGSESADESVEGSSASYVEIDAGRRSSSSGSPSRYSSEDTARSIAFVFVGKPHLVDIVSASPVATSASASIRSRSSSLRPRAIRAGSYSATPCIPAHRPSVANTASLSSRSNASLKSRTNHLSTLSQLTTTMDHPPRTTSIPQSAASQNEPSNGYLASEASQMQWSSPSSPETPHSAATAISTSTSASTLYTEDSRPSSAWRSGLGRVYGARKRPSITSLSSVFKEAVAGRPTPKRQQSTFGINTNLSIREDAIEDSAIPSPARSETSFERKRRSRLSLNLSSLQMSPNFSRALAYGESRGRQSTDERPMSVLARRGTDAEERAREPQIVMPEMFAQACQAPIDCVKDVTGGTAGKHIEYEELMRDVAAAHPPRSVEILSESLTRNTSSKMKNGLKYAMKSVRTRE